MPEGDEPLMAGAVRITGARITPVAFADPPLLNSVGVHQPYALRAIVEVDTDAGLTGLGETYADDQHLARLRAAAGALAGHDVFALSEMCSAVAGLVGGEARHRPARADRDDHGRRAPSTGCSRRSRWPAWTCRARRSGGRCATCSAARSATGCRSAPTCSTSGPPTPARRPDAWGAALDPDGIVAQARRMVAEYGFTAIKLKGGVFAARARRSTAIRALRAGVPRPPAAARPQRRLDRADLAARWPPSWTASWSTWRTRPPASTAWPRWPGRRRCRWPPTCASSPSTTSPPAVAARLGAGGALRPPLLGRAAPLPAARRDLRHLRAGPVDALQLASGHQPGRDDASRGRDAQPDLRLRHPLAVEDRGRRAGGRSSSATARSPCRRRRAWASSSTATRSAELHEQYLSCGIRDRDDTGYRQSVEPGYRPRTW